MTVNTTISGDRCGAETWRSCIENLRQGCRPRFASGIARETGQGEFGVSSQRSVFRSMPRICWQLRPV